MHLFKHKQILDYFFKIEPSKQKKNDDVEDDDDLVTSKSNA